MASRSGRLKAIKVEPGVPVRPAQSPRLVNGPRTQSPDERLRDVGAGALSDAELLAVLLRFGRSTAANALDQAGRLLSKYGGLDGIRAANSDLHHQPAVGGIKTTHLLAAFEVASRLAKAKLPERDLLNRPENVAQFLNLKYKNIDQEILGALYLDVRNRLILETEIYRGTLGQVTVEPRQVLKLALLRSAKGIVLWHTHPSGDPNPSLQDLNFTRRMFRASGLMGVRLVDHIILGDATRWVSLRDCRDFWEGLELAR